MWKITVDIVFISVNISITDKQIIILYNLKLEQSTQRIIHYYLPI